MAYEHTTIEEKWLKQWEEDKLFWDSAKGDAQEKMYLLFAFAYPSGSGLHVGHVESKTALDILARYYRMKGKQVFFPVGWDAFGLPAENYAIKTGVPPVETTKQAIKTFERQVRRVGISYDWANEIATCHPEYYKWTQWLFLQLYKKGLAFKSGGMVNWCPSCQTVLANEQVVNGECERCGTKVVQKELDQWYFKITQYQDELISGLDEVDWPKATKDQQVHWIGKKEGVKVTFSVKSPLFDFAGPRDAADATQKASTSPGSTSALTVFTTRVDTIFGVSFVVIAPEVAKKWIDSGWNASQTVKDYVEAAFHKTEEERKIGEKDKTGVDTGLKAFNPVNGEEVALWVADYVLMDVGTGAVMGVPAHDERDYAFAKKFNLPIKQVINKAPDTAISYLMGADDVSDKDLLDLGVEIVGKSDSGSRKIRIPVSQLPDYEALIEKNLSPGFWNEYLGKETVFIFKHNDGKIERLSLTHETESTINSLASQFNPDTPEKTSVWTWLVDNEFYKSEMIHSDYGVLVNSGEFDGITSEEAMEKIPAAFPLVMNKTTTYKLRDWLISRQRYWGAPIPVVYDPKGNPHLVKEEHLPWVLPTDVDFKPTGESPLRSSKEFIERTERLYGKGWRPEFDTMDTFVDSSWYYLRYVDSRNKEVFAAKEQLAKWLPVDFYMIGPEHIVLHLLYARFFTKFLRDEGYFSFNEPFKKMRHQGMILGPDHRKMSKSKGNVIDPDEVIKLYGADTLRVYEMFMGPIDADKPWSTTSVVGVYRFLNKVWDLVSNSLGDEAQGDEALKKGLHSTLKKVSEDIPELKFNTAIAEMMKFINLWTEAKTKLSKDDLSKFVRMMAPFAPFMAEEMWARLQNQGQTQGSAPTPAHLSVHMQPWPEYDPTLAQGSEYVVVVQVNGKVRQSLTIAVSDYENWGQPQFELESMTKESPKMQKWFDGKEVFKTIFIPPQANKQGILNFIVR